MKTRIVAVTALLALMAAACGTGDNLSATTTTTTQVTTTSVIPTSLADIAALPDGTVVEVNGQLWQNADGFLVCAALNRANPPGCVGDRVIVTNLDAAGYTWLGEGEVKWTSSPVTVTGSVSDGTLVAD